jgi:hypothetical protein
MESKDSQHVPEAEGREDDRNELAEGSPIPDPEDEPTGADDIPEAD